MLKLIPDDEIAFDSVTCADCGYEILIPESWSLPYELDKYICSTCWAIRANEYQKKKLAEQHKPIGEQPPARQLTEPEKGETLDLFKK